MNEHEYWLKAVNKNKEIKEKQSKDVNKTNSYEEQYGFKKISPVMYVYFPDYAPTSAKKEHSRIFFFSVCF